MRACSPRLTWLLHCAVTALASGSRATYAASWQILTIATLDVLTNVAQVWASSNLGGHAGFLGMLVQQMVLPCSVLVSATLLQTKHTGYHISGAFVVVCGVAVSTAPQFFGHHASSTSGTGGGVGSDTLFLAVYLVSVVPEALNKVWKEFLFQSAPQLRAEDAAEGVPLIDHTVSGAAATTAGLASRPARRGSPSLRRGCLVGCGSAFRRSAGGGRATANGAVSPVHLGALENATETPLALLLSPLYFAVVLRRSPSEEPSYASDAWNCLIGEAGGTCSTAPADVAAFIVVGTFALASTLMLIKHSSATIVCVGTS